MGTKRDYFQNCRKAKNWKKKYGEWEYKESGLARFGMKRKMMKDIRSIRGDNLWTVDVEGQEEGILVIPRTLGMDEFCSQHGRLSAFMIVELVLHDWAKGIEHTMLKIEEVNSFRTMRLVPIYGRRFQLDDMLYKMEMHPAGVLSSSEEWIEQTWIPRSLCQIDGSLLYGERN